MQQHPNFMVVGAAKSGTTSLYYYLREHPEVFVPSKETYFFSPQHAKQAGAKVRVDSEATYRALFGEGLSAHIKASGEVSSCYLYTYRESIPLIKKYLGDIRIVMVLRNPAERAFSHYMYFARDLRVAARFEDAIEEERVTGGKSSAWPRHYLHMGFYHDQVRDYLENFRNVKIYITEELHAATGHVIQDLYRFLGVDSSFSPDTSRRYNVSGVPRNTFIQWLFFKPTRSKLAIKQFLVDHFFGDELVSGIIEKLRSKNLMKVSMAPETRRHLVKLYRNDVLKVQQLIRKDLSSWLESP